MMSKIARYAWSEDVDDRFDEAPQWADTICTDRLTGEVIVRYDMGDPANYNPAYGGWSKDQYLEEQNRDPRAEIDPAESKVTVPADEVDAYAARKARREQREAEEAAATDLFDLLDDKEIEGFAFEDYYDGEHDILAPALAARGYRDVGFYMVEQDSFGPLIRGVRATDPTGKNVRFFYG
ncbi:MAG: hypothetical protein ACYCZ0_03325 [Minisyncoccota bacterium]